MTVCNSHDCNLSIYGDTEKCILHCEKSSYSIDYHKGDFLPLFYEELINYIIAFLFDSNSSYGNINEENLKKYFSREMHNSNNDVQRFIKDKTVVFTKIFFPSFKARDAFDYFKVLTRLTAIHFDSCEFSSNGFNLRRQALFYNDCKFHSFWIIYDSNLLSNPNNVIYQECVFNKAVGTTHDDDKKMEISNSLFNDCDFKEKLEFYSIKFNAPLFNNSDNYGTQLKSFVITDCLFDERFVLNDCSISNYYSDSNIFNSKFEFKSNEVEKFKVTNTNHSSIFDAFKTKFEFFHIHKSIFEDYVGFEDCKFGLSDDRETEKVAIFKYATFLSFVNFRNTLFAGGLDIELINLNGDPNFLNTKINEKFTNRESFRIIKNSFDKIGNHIEANKYFVNEMRKYKLELAGTNNTQEKFIIFLNEKISNFGQSYLRPVFWIIFTALVYWLILLGYENNTLYSIYKPFNSTISVTASALNGIASGFLPLAKFLKNGMEFISLVFYVIFAGLVWQTVVAVKRHTKR